MIVTGLTTRWNDLLKDRGGVSVDLVTTEEQRGKDQGLLSAPEQQGAMVVTAVAFPQTVSDRRKPHSQMVSVIFGAGGPCVGPTLLKRASSADGEVVSHMVLTSARA